MEGVDHLNTDEMKRLKRKGRKGIEMKWSRRGSKGRRPTAGMKVKGGRSRSRPVKWAGLRTAEGQPEIGLPGGVPSTYLPGPDPWDMWEN